MPGVAVRRSPAPRSGTRWFAIAIRVALGCVAIASSCLPWPGHAHAEDLAPTVRASHALDALATEDTWIPEDTVLIEQLEDAIDLRRREDFDRVLDAREPGELVEHATLTEVDFDHRKMSIETLFVVGDELFAYLFRPENGWGGNQEGRDDVGFTPRLQRVHRGAAGGPDAFACSGCHSKGGPDGAGTQTQNAFFRGDAQRTAGADQRNAPHLLGLGPIELLAREMSADLQAEAAEAREQAVASGRAVQTALVSKGVRFGTITIGPDGRIDSRGIDGVDPDLVVRPFGWKGHRATLREMAEESLHLHQGLLSKSAQLGVRDGTVDPTIYGGGPWYDVDLDGVSLEIDSGMLSTVVGYLAQLEVPVLRPPHDPALLDAFARGKAAFDQVGCGGCHVPTLELEQTELDPRGQRDEDVGSYAATSVANAGDGADPHAADEEAAQERVTFVIDVAKDGDGPKIEPKYAGATTSYLVHLFSDLKRHDMGAALATPSAQGDIPATVFLTRPLWGLAETAPYLHDGRAPTIHDAVLLHGGEAAAARDAYLALDPGDQASLRVFLACLSRQPKLFVP